MASRRVVQYLLDESRKGERVEPLNPDLVAELCRAWLALDAAPEVLLNFDAIPGGNVVCTYDIDIHHELVGQRVRLVATPTTRGPSE